MKVVTPDGKPVVGAVIREGMYAGSQGDTPLGVPFPGRWIWRAVGTTDADGRLVTRVPSRSPLFQQGNFVRHNYMAEKPGFKAAFSGLNDVAYWNGKDVDGDVKEVRFTLPVAKPRKGRIMLGEGVPLAGYELHVGLDLSIKNAKGTGSMGWHMSWTLPTDADGRFVIPDAAGVGEQYWLALKGPGLVEQLVPEELHRQTPLQFVALHPRRVDAKPPVEIDLSKLHRLQLKFSTADGIPAGATSLMLLSSVNEFYAEPSGPRADTDTTGRVTLLVEPGNWHLFARCGDTMFHKPLQVDQDLELKPTLVPMPTLRGRVVDAKGQPVADAQLNTLGSSFTQGARDPMLEKIAKSCNWNWISQTRSDENGEFSCSWLDLLGMTYDASFRLGSRTSARMRLAVEDDVTVVLP
jgi:hypothetical protein